MFIFEDSNVHDKDWQTCSGGSDRSGELCYNFFVTNDFTQLVLTCLLTSLTVTLIVLLFWIYFFLLMVVFVLQWLFLHWEILIVLSQGMPISLHSLRLFLCWLGGSFEGCSMGGYL